MQLQISVPHRLQLLLLNQKNVRKGQTYANRFTSAQIPVTGQRDTATVKAGIKVFQTALNKDYGAGLVVDGIFGLNTDKALGKHYVTSGECQYMVTAAEILLLLHGYNPNGVEIPGIFGIGSSDSSQNISEKHRD